MNFQPDVLDGEHATEVPLAVQFGFGFERRSDVILFAYNRSSRMRLVFAAIFAVFEFSRSEARYADFGGEGGR